MPPSSLRQSTRALVRLLAKKKARLVFAESCTGGLLASLLTEIPGVSDVFCGSHVVYREDSKTRWLGVKKTSLERWSAVSAEVAAEMARGALARTPEATIAASVTGYLGPKGERVGQGFICVLKRSSKKDAARPTFAELTLTPRKQTRFKNSVEARLERRELAALAVIFLVRSSLEV